MSSLEPESEQLCTVLGYVMATLAHHELDFRSCRLEPSRLKPPLVQHVMVQVVAVCDGATPAVLVPSCFDNSCWCRVQRDAGYYVHPEPATHGRGQVRGGLRSIT